MMQQETDPSIQIKILHVYFKNKIRLNEIPAFRAAISNTAGRENILFHHHDGEGFLYKYPLIQYKVVSGSSMLFCIDPAIEQLTHFFGKTERVLELNGARQNLEVTTMRQFHYKLQVHEKYMKYAISNWLPLNQENYRKYTAINTMKERIIFLEKLLTANILSFAKGVEWTVSRKIEVNLLELPPFRVRKIKNVNMQLFNASFETNVFLPNYAGLGKLTSIGFGTVKAIK